MRFGPLVLTLLLVLTSNSPALAQKQNFELGGGGGFTWPSDPEVSLGRGWDLGGFFGIRFNDNFSLETDFSFSRTNNQFFDESIPIVPTQEGEGWTFQPFSPIEPFTDFGLQNTQYHLDAVLVIHIGRRQPFHPFVFGGRAGNKEGDQLLPRSRGRRRIRFLHSLQRSGSIRVPIVDDQGLGTADTTSFLHSHLLLLALDFTHTSGA
jgi:hypothetical protein